MRSAWNTVASAYQKRYKIGTKRIHYGPLCPSDDELKLLGNLAGTKFLEIGSGAGQNSIVAAKAGADVTAIDISEKQIEIGKQISRDENVNIDFKVGSFLDFSDMDYLDEFDTVLSVYALQYCYDISEMSEVFKAIHKALKPNGKFIFSLDHPIRSHGNWMGDTFIFDNYFDRSPKEWSYDFPEMNIATPMTGTYKTIGDYCSCLSSAGFIIQKILEPEPVATDDNSKFGQNSRYGVYSKEDPFSYSRLQRVPGTIIFQATKPQ